MNQSGGTGAMIFIVISTAWSVGTICFIVLNSTEKRWSQLLLAVSSVFIVQIFLTQMETYFFGSAFADLTGFDIMMIVLAGLLTIMITGILAIFLFRKTKQADDRQEAMEINWSRFLWTAVLNGLFYMIIYFLFGYFVAWQSAELRLFYTGSTEMMSFTEKILDNLKATPFIFPCQWIRGFLFTMTVLPFLRMRWKHKFDYHICIIAVFLCTTIGLIIPNFLFPDVVRWTHFREMFSSMLLFGCLSAVLTTRSVLLQKKERKERRCENIN